MSKMHLPHEDMVERVAVAIEKTMFAPHEFPLGAELHQLYRGTARAAIQAMREPTRPMWAHAGTMFVNCQGRELHHDRACGLVWDAMLAAALEPHLAEPEDKT